MNQSLLTRSACAGLIVFAAGCSTWSPRQANLPGSTIDQQRAAVVFDPYANENIAPPVVGGRPRDFQKDFAEPQRSTLLSDGW